MRETTESVIEIHDWSYSAYLNMIEYLYTGQIEDFNHSVALDILGLADAYSIDNLKMLAENTLIHNVDAENVIHMLIDAHRFSALDLKKFCMEFTIKNFAEVQGTMGFSELEGVPSLLMEVTKQIACLQI